MRVYLSGPITGLKKSNIEGWRQRVSSLLPPGVQIIDPARSDYNEAIAFQKHENISDAMERLRHGRFIVDRNKNLIRNCDVVLANFLGVKTRVSIGSVGELHWADAFGIPIVVVRDKHGNVHDHAMLNAIASEICFDLDAACQTIAKMVSISQPRSA
jgi:nucleoside 2-deoxyribosyltransferase